MKAFKILCIFIIPLVVTGCLKPPTISKQSSIENYEYALIPNTNSLSSGTGGVYGNEYGVYGSSVSKSVNPRDVIQGVLLKKGMVTVPEIKPDLVHKTLIVNYGESGKRYVAGGLWGYTLEVTIKFIDAESYETIYACTAEGQGSTEADDIREAIGRCLSGL